MAERLPSIEALGISDYFDTTVISEVEGVSKPDRRIFEIAMDRLGVTANQAVFVWDHPDVDIRGAQNAGMRAIWKRDEYWGPCSFADGVIDGLHELREVLDAYGGA